MNERILWEKFKRTGKITDYLAYLDSKNQAKEYEKNVLGNVK